MQQSVNNTPISKSAEGKGLTMSKTSSNRVNVPITTSSSNHSSNKNPKRLSKDEINRRELGLCFKCEEKFGPSHKCKGKQLRMLAVEEEEEEDPRGYVVEEVEEDTPEKLIAAMELSLTSMVGFTSNQTMKLTRMLKGQSVTVLIDCGASHNFISLGIVEELGIAVQQVGNYSVTVGESRKIYANVGWPDVELELQGLTIVQTFYPFNLANIDIVLGIAWLKSLCQLYMKVKVEKRWICLKGDPRLTHTQVLFKAIKKALRGSKEGYLLEIQAKTVENRTGTAAVQTESRRYWKNIKWCVNQ